MVLGLNVGLELVIDVGGLGLGQFKVLSSTVGYSCPVAGTSAKR